MASVSIKAELHILTLGLNALRRSDSLRTYAGDTSLPGGKVDPEDRSIEDTARREAFEEVSSRATQCYSDANRASDRLAERQEQGPSPLRSGAVPCSRANSDTVRDPFVLERPAC